MAGIKDFSTTAANNTTVGSVSVAEGMLPSTINNAFRGLAAEIREWFNDSQWVIYGDGDGSFTITYASATSFTVSGVDVTSFYHVGRRVKAIATTPGTIFGTISASTFSTNTTVTVTWDSGSLANEAVTIYVGALSKTNDSIPELVITNAKISASAAIDLTKIGSGAVSRTEFGYLDGVTSAIQTQLDAKLVKANNLSDLTSTSTARTNLGLGTIATQAANAVAITGGSISGLSSPTTGSEPTTKTYVDNLVTGLSTRIICRAASTADVTIASALENGDTLDGVTLVTGDRVLLKNQTTDSQNGIYTVVASGSASRDTQFDTITELAGQLVIIQEGTVNADTFHLCTTDTSATLGSSSILFTKVTPSNSGTVTSIAAGTGLTGGTITSSGTLAIDTGVVTTLTDTQTLTNKTLTLPTIDNIKIGYSTTATAAGTTTLTVSSNYKQYFTGSTTQTIVLPVVSTLTLGHTFEIHNNSSGSLTVNSSGSNLVGTINANTTATCTCILTTGTTAASWDFDLTGFTTALPIIRGGTGLTALGTSLQSLRVNSGATALEFATASAGFSGATTTSSAVDITLTSASTQVQNVTMTAADKAVILPDATTLTTKGTPILYIRNNGTTTFDVKLNSGFILTTLRASQDISLILIDNATTDGIWRNETSSIYNTHFVGNFLYSPFALVKSGTTGSPAITLVYSHNCSGDNGISASKISTSSAIVCYHNGTSNRDIYAVVVSYSGTTITVNSETLLYNGSSTASTGSQILMLTATEGLLFVTRASNNVAVPFTISGTTITAGTASSTFGSGTGTGSEKQLGNAIAMDSTIALIPDRNSTTTATWTLRTITHNGASAPTIGTASSAITTGQLYMVPSLTKIDSTNAFASYQVASTSYTVARVITISGASAPTLQTANTSAAVNYGFAQKSVRISATEFIVVSQFSSMNYTVSGTSVTYVGGSLYKSSKKTVLNDDWLHLVFPFNNGSNAITEGRNNFIVQFSDLDSQANRISRNITVVKKDGNFMELSNTSSSSKFFSHGQAENTTSASCYVELDTNILLGVTNDNYSNYGTIYYTSTPAIHTTILKYVGA